MSETERRILIVDDEPANIHVLAKVLEGSYQLFFATSGEKALALAAEQEVDLVLLDVVMPELDGFEVLKRLKADELTASIPVIFVTAMTEVEDEARGFNQGAVDYIPKPVSPPIVRARVSTHLELKRQRDLLEQRAFLDGLTGIPNRMRFDQRLDSDWRSAARRKDKISLIMIDVDFFKQFNDSYGHSVGDDCLKGVAKAMCESLRRPEDLAARYGGEEFVMLLPGTDGGGVRNRVRDLLNRVRSLAIPHKASPSGIVSVSAGGTTLEPAVSEDPVSAVQVADKLLYEAKSEGRDRAILVDETTGERTVLRPSEE